MSLGSFTLFSFVLTSIDLRTWGFLSLAGDPLLSIDVLAGLPSRGLASLDIIPSSLKIDTLALISPSSAVLLRAAEFGSKVGGLWLITAEVLKYVGTITLYFLSNI